MEHDLVLLGVYATKRAVVDARAQYWKAKEPRSPVDATRAVGESRDIAGVRETAPQASARPTSGENIAALNRDESNEPDARLPAMNRRERAALSTSFREPPC